MEFHLLSVSGLLCCLAFFFAGIVDSVCGGGGLLTVPAMLLAGVPVPYITGTNQCSAWVGGGIASYQYIKSGNVHLRSALITLPFAIMGSYLGARLNLLVPIRYLELFMLVMIPVVALFTLCNRHLGESEQIDRQPPFSIAAEAAGIGLVLGCYQGFYGPGAGMFFMLAYAAFMKLSLVHAVGNTRFVVAAASTVSVLTYVLSHAVLWKLALAASIFNVIGSYLGVVYAIKIGSRLIRPIMLGIVGLLFLKLVVEAAYFFQKSEPSRRKLLGSDFFLLIIR